MLELEQAVARILEAIPPPVSERVPLADCCGRVLLESLDCLIDLPPFDNSAMDGYAVRAADLLPTPRSAAPTWLRVIGKLAAGETFAGRVGCGECVRLFTGSPLPEGADAVVMQEETRSDPDRPGEVQILAPVVLGENVRPRGEDVRAGQRLAEQGSVITAGALSLLAAAGVTHVQVGRRPVVGLLATGSELVEPGMPLGPGRVYESNRVGLAALVRGAGGIPEVFPLVQDSLPATQAALTRTLEQCDLVVTSGGVSVGEFDFVKAAFEAEGGSLEFWRVAIKPGRPFVFGRQGKKLLFGLPGNPVSALVTFVLLVRPALRRWQGAVEVSPSTWVGTAAQSLENDGNRRHFLRVKIDSAGHVSSAGKQASHLLSALATANGLADIPPNTTVLKSSPVRVIRWE